MKVIRVFPRRTRATPIDGLAVVNRTPELFDTADEVHVSVAFSWDLPLAEKLAKDWRCVAPVRIGGPATGERGGDFVSGRYVREGYTVTSRGCPNRCWFCSVWKREGNEVRELPICDGWNVLDDNLLACSESHTRAVFAMLARQKRKPQFTGGLEAKLLKPWHAEALRALKPNQLFFAYDTADDLEPLREAGRMLQECGLGLTKTGKFSHRMRCYVLCGWPNDTIDAATIRIREAMDAGFTPMAMAYRDKDGNRTKEWAKFQRRWARVKIVHATVDAQGCPKEGLEGGKTIDGMGKTAKGQEGGKE
jgi:hypothetical protein